MSAVLTQLSWTNHLLIMSGSKSEEEREFYMRLAVKERYSSRQLERQMDSGYYERYMLSKSKLLPEPLNSQQNPFLDQYVVEFLDLPDTFHENDFRRALVKGMRDFILELGRDFTFIGEEYPIQVGGEDYRIDLLFFHRLPFFVQAASGAAGKAIGLTAAAASKTKVLGHITRYSSKLCPLALYPSNPCSRRTSPRPIVFSAFLASL